MSKRAAYKNYRNFVFEKLEKELKLLENYDNLSAVDKKNLDKTTHKMSSVCQHYLTDEYKITINNNEVINEKVNACYVDMSPLYG